jgi:DNA-binding transcriptional ArsR family regulator
MRSRTVRRSSPDPRGRLRLLVGEARAAVIAAVAEPRTTGEVAAAIKISPSTASEHLEVLNRCGIVERRRSGRFVHYELNARGSALVELLDAD